MPRPLLRTLILATVLGIANLHPAQAEPLPAAPEPLKDFAGSGYIQIDLPPGKGEATGLKLWFPFRQAFVRPDRMVVDIWLQNVLQRTLMQTSTERTYSPATGYIIERAYKNIESSPDNPMAAATLSMSTWAKVLRELETGKVLPAEDLDKLKESHKARIEELRKLRESLKTSTNVEDLPRAEAAALESARLNDDLQQIEIRKQYPCYVVEYENKHLMESLLSRGLTGEGAKALLSQGKTRVWMTKAHGMPVKIETSANDGRVAIYLAFVQLKVNDGMHPGELVMGAPPGTRVLSATADLRDRNWHEKMEAALSRQIEALDKERTDAQDRVRRKVPPKPGRK